MNMTEIRLIVGLDWADSEHVCSLREPSALFGRIERVGAAPEVFGPWLDTLCEKYPPGSIAVVLERPDGAVVHLLQSKASIVVVAINPTMLHRFRQAFTPSGAKDDPSDAALLAELLIRHSDKLRPLPRIDSRVSALASLTRQRRELIAQRTLLVQKLVALLKNYYPQALQLAGTDLTAPLALAFLRRWPDLILLKSARWTSLEKFYRENHCGRAEVLAQRRQLIADARIVSSQTSYLKICRLQLEALLVQLSALAPVIGHYDQVIEEEYGEVPGRNVIDSLPGAGPAMAPRLWVACAQAGASPTSLDLAQASGVAPVQRQSGKTRRVCFRHARPLFLHQSWLEFAYHSLAGSQWAREFYQKRKAIGHGNNAILRALAFKWTRIVARLWRDQVLYNEALYLKNLKTCSAAA